jgi:hypothetical protein
MLLGWLQGSTPPRGIRQKMFIRELRPLRQTALPNWLILGDFNLIYQDVDKSNSRVKRRLMLIFRRALNFLKVKKINLIVRKYTWSNWQEFPTVSIIDKVFYTPGWEDLFRNPIVQPLSSVVYDHYPLLVTPISFPKLRPSFKFESFWTGMEGFYDCVKEAWGREVPANQDALATLHIRPSRTSKALKAWSKNIMSRVKIAMAIWGRLSHNLIKLRRVGSLWKKKELYTRPSCKYSFLSFLAAVDF